MIKRIKWTLEDIGNRQSSFAIIKFCNTIDSFL